MTTVPSTATGSPATVPETPGLSRRRVMIVARNDPQHGQRNAANPVVGEGSERYGAKAPTCH